MWKPLKSLFWDDFVLFSEKKITTICRINFHWMLRSLCCRTCCERQAVLCNIEEFLWGTFQKIRFGISRPLIGLNWCMEECLGRQYQDLSHREKLLRASRSRFCGGSCPLAKSDTGPSVLSLPHQLTLNPDIQCKYSFTWCKYPFTQCKYLFTQCKYPFT